jgi:hypothetical protein
VRRSPVCRSALLAAALAVAAFAHGGGSAAASDAAADLRRAEAKARFDRGMKLLEERDDAGALAELRRAQELSPERQTLLMIGVLYGTMNRPVEALAALDRVLEQAAALSPEQRAVARQRREEQARKVGYLRVVVSAPAAIEIDGIEAGRAPDQAAIPVAAGAHLVAALSPGHVPARKEVLVAGGVTEELRFDLVPSELRAAHLFVRTALPDADVLIDGERVARTPLPGSITVQPGTRSIELRRTGYQSASGQLTLGDGATGELALTPRELSGPQVERGRLVLDISEPDAELVIDGEPRGVYRGGLLLPRGRHHLRVARAGFLASERLVDVAGSETRVRVQLAPTTERREAYLARARAFRRWGSVGATAGLVLAAGAGMLLVIQRGPLADARAQQARVAARFERGQPCDPRGGGDHIQCDRDLAAADDELSRRRTRRNLALAGLGLGVAAAALGTAALWLGDDPARYDTPQRASAAGLSVAPGAPGAGGGGLWLSGRF